MRRSELLFGKDNQPTKAFAAFMRAIKVPGENLLSINAALQNRFFQKNPNGSRLERWELGSIETPCSPTEFREHLCRCGFFVKTFPALDKFDYAGWPGGIVSRAGVRLFDLVEVWKQGIRWKKTIVFGSQRPRMENKEGFSEFSRCLPCRLTPAELDDIRAQWKAHPPETESDAMRWLWNFAPMPNEMRSVPVVFVDALMNPPEEAGGKPVRPNSEDTIRAWLDQNPAPGSFLLSSGAPYGMSQDEAWWTLLGPRGFTVNTFGHSAPDLAPEAFMREVAGCVNRILNARLG